MLTHTFAQQALVVAVGLTRLADTDTLGAGWPIVQAGQMRVALVAAQVHVLFRIVRRIDHAAIHLVAGAVTSDPAIAAQDLIFVREAAVFAVAETRVVRVHADAEDAVVLVEAALVFQVAGLADSAEVIELNGAAAGHQQQERSHETHLFDSFYQLLSSWRPLWVAAIETF